jgi:hypothetical protein
MSKMTYGEQLLHPKWQRLRLQVFDAAGWACERCGETEQTLHAHHRKYRDGAMAWEYAIGEIACLCSLCHSTEHGRGKPPAGSRSAKRDVWELLAGFHLRACAEAADHPGIEANAATLDRHARELCAAAGYDYDALEALLLA